jgi:hypothetical protein
VPHRTGARVRVCLCVCACACVVHVCVLVTTLCLCLSGRALCRHAALVLEVLHTPPPCPAHSTMRSWRPRWPSHAAQTQRRPPGTASCPPSAQSCWQQPFWRRAGRSSGCASTPTRCAGEGHADWTALWHAASAVRCAVPPCSSIDCCPALIVCLAACIRWSACRRSCAGRGQTLLLLGRP